MIEDLQLRTVTVVPICDPDLIRDLKLGSNEDQDIKEEDTSTLKSWQAHKLSCCPFCCWKGPLLLDHQY